jgi:hypothetical protein
MIKFLNDETVAGHRFGKGAIAIFDSATETSLISVGDAVDFPAVVKPVEVLSSSAVIAPCVTTAVDEVLALFTIRAGMLGVNSILQIEPLWTFGNSANNKILKVKIAGVTVYSATRTTSVKEAPLIVLMNRNSLSSQIQPYDNGYVTAGLGAPATYSIDFSTNVTVQITGQRASTGDALALEYYRSLHFVGD